jgi:hypothetical protein
VQALGVIFRRRPLAVLGMGGFASGPGGVAAWLTRRPLVIHEQNAAAGMTNRLLARLARVVLQAFPGSFNSSVTAETVGNPVREDIAAVPPPHERYASRQGVLRVLVLGGGTIGLLCAVALRGRAREVAITCRYPHQADLARRYGLTPLDEADLGTWADGAAPGIVIETVGGEADTMATAIAAARPGGRLVVVGVFATPRPTDYRSIVLKELEVVGSIYYGAAGTGSEFGAAVASMGDITTELAALQTHRFALADVAEAFATADDKSSRAVKVTIVPDP